MLVSNALSTFKVDFQSNDFNSNNWEVDAATGGAGSALTLSFSSISSADGTFVATGYDSVDVQTHGNFHEFFGTSFSIVSNVGQPAAVLTIDGYCRRRADGRTRDRHRGD